jgi:predicted SnoaL-like aldol condensation-catalyzing enzyme
MSTTEENKAQFRRAYEELLNQGNLAIADELVAPDFINHEPLPEGTEAPSRCEGWPPCCARPSPTCASR